MEAQQIRLVQESFDQAVPYMDAIIERFYHHLFQANPEMRELFREDLGSQSRKFIVMLRVMVKSLDRFEQVRNSIADMGRRHYRYGVSPDQYEPMKLALLLAFREEMGERFSAEVETAWAAAYDLAAQVMVEAEPVG